MSQEQPGDLTLLISGARGGDPRSSARLFELVYGELRALAGSHQRRQGAPWTLQPTAVVHEVFLRLFDRDRLEYRDRAHFFAIAATAMRQVLVDHARARSAEKRGGKQDRITLDEGLLGTPVAGIDLVALSDALEKLEQFAPRKHRVVELRFFGGLSVEEVAEVLDLGTTTVESEWRAARAWLAAQLEGR